MSKLHIITFTSDEGWGTMFCGTNVNKVYSDAWDLYHMLLTGNDLDDNGDDTLIANGIIEFATKKPDCIPIESRYYPRINYFMLDADALPTGDKYDWD